MNKNEILESWNAQFSNIDKLKISDVKELYKKIEKTNNEELRKVYYDKIILGTQYVVYRYLKSTNLHLLSGVEVGAEDVIATTYETWIENIKNDNLKKIKTFNLITQSNSFSSSIEKKLGFSGQFTPPLDNNFYRDRNCYSETVFGSLNDSDLKNAFTKYYRFTKSYDGNSDIPDDIFGDNNLSINQKLKIIALFDKASEYLDSTIENNSISDTNLGKYIKLIIGNTIVNSLDDSYDSVDERNFDKDIINNDIRKKLLETFKNTSLSEQEEYILRSRYGIDGGKIKSLATIGRKYQISPLVVNHIENKALCKLRHSPNTKNLKSLL